MMCIKRRAKVCRVAAGPLHFTQLTQAKYGANSTFKYIMLDLLDIKQANVTKIEASNYMRIIAARLNAKPYGIRFVAKSDIGPLDSAQDLSMEVISPNHWKISE